MSKLLKCPQNHTFEDCSFFALSSPPAPPSLSHTFSYACLFPFACSPSLLNRFLFRSFARLIPIHPALPSRHSLPTPLTFLLQCWKRKRGVGQTVTEARGWVWRRDQLAGQVKKEEVAVGQGWRRWALAVCGPW